MLEMRGKEDEEGRLTLRDTLSSYHLRGRAVWQVLEEEEEES